jgi:pimeloyl-ACP methyl ester carboxylesterase
VDLALTVSGPDDGTPVVLLHGLTATHRYVVMGSSILQREHHRVVAYDARGHGKSEPQATYTYEDLAHDLERVLDDQGIDRAVLAGASMGAHTILRFALDHPERVAAAAIITPAHAPDGGDREASLERWDQLAHGLRTGGVEGFVHAYGDPQVPEAWKETVLKVIRQRLALHEHPEAVADALEQVPRSHPFEALADLERIDVPAIVVASRDEADPGHPLAVGEAYAEHLPQAELLTEDEGQSPLAWQGSRLSKAIAELAARAEL